MDNRKIPFIIAEIGINHNGDIEIAKKLIDMAKAAGCDAVKFQKRTLNVVYDKDFLDSPRKSPWGTTQREQKEGLEFGKKEYDEINQYCKKVGIEWFASAWDIESQKFLRQYNLKHNKVASAMLTHLPLLKEIASEKKHTFISTGMSTFEDIDKAIEIFKKHDCPFTLMHCVSTYPCLDEDCNLSVMMTLKDRYGCDIGYSGHEVGILPTVAAAALGATVIERHITPDRAMYGSDQAASLEKRGLEYVVKYSRAIPAIIGDGAKKITDSELSVSKKLRYFRED
jgi:N-acetylneuraminate synthase